MFKRQPGFGIYISVNRLCLCFVVMVLGFGQSFAPAANTSASLLVAATTARPGDTVMTAVRLQMAPGWHTYWKNGGASGIATKISWQLPAGITAGEIQWPTPDKFIPEKVDDDGKAIPGSRDYEQTTYVFHDEVLLLVPLQISATLVPGKYDLKARVEWLECNINCLPAKAEVSGVLGIGDTAETSSEAPIIEAGAALLPKPGDALAARASWEQPAGGKTRSLLIEWHPPAATGNWDFYSDPLADAEVLYQTDLVSTNAGDLVLRKQVAAFGDTWPEEIAGLLVNRNEKSATSYAVRLKVAPSNSGPESTAASPTVVEQKPLWRWLLYAFVGGLILNIMPCVLPVIALKILGFVGQAKEAPARVRWLGIVYAIGVLTSFAILAAVIVGIKAAGHTAGWGMQFSNPQFIVGMAALITLVALNLFGVFEVTLGGRTLGAAGELASRHGASGAFFNGVLATVLSTPCSAPFLGAALGFAFSQPAGIIVLIFLTVGLGLASPYVILSWQPAWLKFLPRPGAWMEKFKMAMGFPMLITAVWLTSLVGTFYGEQAWWLGVFLVLLGAAAWVFGEFYQRGSHSPILGILFSFLALGGAYFWALESGLDWRHPQQQAESGAKVAHAPKGYDWQRWSAEAVNQARAEGRVVVVDFTASWCQTCKISVKPGFEAKSVVDKLNQLKAVALVADYTSFPKEITEELQKYGRNAVPVVLVYPADKSKPAMVLPEPLPYPAPYGPVILAALEKG